MAFAVPVWVNPRDDEPSHVLFLDRQPTVILIANELKALFCASDKIQLSQDGSALRPNSSVNYKKGPLIYEILGGQMSQFVTELPLLCLQKQNF
jgi:hypothetical protein